MPAKPLIRDTYGVAAVLSGQIRSIKDSGNRRILPEYVDEYIRRKVQEAAT